MPRILVCGDPHLQHQRLDENRLFLSRFRELIPGHDMVVLLGDLLHNFAIIRSEVLSLWNEFFDSCPGANIVSLVGNHDYSGQQGGTHALEVFRSRIRVIDKLGTNPGPYMLPFMRDKEAFIAECKKIPPGNPLFCHQSFLGAEFSSGFQDPEGVDPKVVAHLSWVISGHIHGRQTIGNIWYPGTPYQTNFGEAGSEKRVYTVDITPESFTIVKEHDLGLPQYHVIEADDLARLKEMVPDRFDSTHRYKLVGQGTPQEIVDFWKDPKVQRLRSGAKQVVDGLAPKRGGIVIPGSHTGTKEERLDAFIGSKEWRTTRDRVGAAARAFLSQ